MSLKKTVAIAAAVGAMAAISVPAMALENEFHGTYTFNGIFSNFMNGGAGDFNPAARGASAVAGAGVFTLNPVTGVISQATPAVAAKPNFGNNRQMNNYFEQRARIQYTAKVSDDLKLVTQFELDTRFGGITDNKYTSSNDSGRLDADGISFETKHVYLDFNLGSNFNTKLGVQPYKDTIKGLFIDADLPAIMTTTKIGAYTLGLGFSRFAEDYQSASTTLNRLGDGAKDLFMFDNTFAITKDTKAALSYYLLADYTATPTGGYSTSILDAHTKDQAILLNTFALSGETKIGPVSLSGFAAMQAGHQKHATGALVPPSTTLRSSSVNFHGYAANVAAKLAVGPGTAKTGFLFVSGNNNEGDAQNRGWISTGVNSYNDGGMMILVRATQNSPTSTDNYIRKNVTNIALATIGYDANLTDKVYANGNVGFAWAPASKDATLNPNKNGGDFMGTEINLEAGYKVNNNLTLRAQAAYAILDAYYTKATLNTNGSGDAADPENPYTMRLLASFKF